MKVWLSHRLTAILPNKSKFLSPLGLNNLLQLCSDGNALDQGKQVHQQIIVNGLEQNPFMTTKLVQVYADCEDLKSARHMFAKLSHPNVFACTAILSFYSRHGMSNECLGLYTDMKLEGIFPDTYVFPKILKACAQSGQLEVGIQVHKDVITFNAELNLQVSNSLIDMYSKCGNIESARQIFTQMGKRDLLSWNYMISGYVCNESLESAVSLLAFMRLEGFEPDLVTYNTAMDAYCRMGHCDEAWKIFEQIKEPNIISWTTLISGYSRIGNHRASLAIFRKMTHKGEVLPDLRCISGVIVSCRHLSGLIQGREIHAYGIKTELLDSFYKSAGPALLTMYAKCRSIRDTRNMFTMMDKSDVVMWNAMILSYADLGKENLALDCFREMQSMGMQTDQTTLSTTLPVCDLNSGKQIHAHILKNSSNLIIPVSNALIHMYCKCGCITAAYSVFCEMVDKDLVSWNTMIGGFARHGFGQSALQLLKQMNYFGFLPDSLTFTSLLSACNHSGLLEEGLEIFHIMIKDFGSKPRMEHYACVVDLMARSGRLEEAVSFIKTMPLEPDKCIWGALLAASQSHQNISVGVLASENLLDLEPEYAGHYVTLANMYARAGRWDDAVRVRNLMESSGLAKPSGYSWVES